MCADVRAEEERPWRGRIEAGTYLAVTGPASYGATAAATLLPGGSWRRLGLRLSARSLERDDGVFLAGLAFEAAASRPKLSLELFTEAGWSTTSGVAVFGAGSHTTLWVLGPLALGATGGLHLFVDGLDSALAVTGGFSLALAR